MENTFGIAVQIINAAVRDMPYSPGVYKMLDDKAKVLYVGKAKVLPKRVLSYANFAKLSNRIQRMVLQVRHVEYITTATEAEALLLEANLIKSLKPVYNISLRDDKSFPYIVLEEGHQFPRIAKYRGKKADGGSYFGPFASVQQVKVALQELQKVFLLRPCTDAYFASRKRPCIQYEIKRCSAPCVGKITAEEYAKLIGMAKEFLNGKSDKVQAQLVALMEAMSAQMNYEKAASLRDRIRVLAAVQARNAQMDVKFNEADVVVVAKKHDFACIDVYFIRGGKNYGNKSYFQSDVGEMSEGEILEAVLCQFYRNHVPSGKILLSHDCPSKEALEAAVTKATGVDVDIVASKRDKQLRAFMEFALGNAMQNLEKRLKERMVNTQGMEGIAKLFGLGVVPRRIEIYDNSHISGTHAGGCMVVYTDAGFAPHEYRQFTIKSARAADDYGMLREVLIRRLRRLSPDNQPDLLLIDGGRGQMSVALEVLKELGCDDLHVVCISKGPDRNAGLEVLHFADGRTLRLPKDDTMLHFLQVLRDEAHRYAITFHRRKRARALSYSLLDKVSGVGEARKKAILQYFGSVEGLGHASVEDIMRVKGINRNLAEKIFNYLHNA